MASRKSLDKVRLHLEEIADVQCEDPQAVFLKKENEQFEAESNE